ncbi:LOW QUALITY PROTEIN: hypothetical protein CFC21_112422 [Triticum aestivum]|uniref:Uncharacterized protein n=2 Tax=Triticum aestivum TaxID=4565 RepID=A0A3B6U8H4_WHEAT|nr:hypothetical protein [Triticum aestivum]
MKRQQHGEVDAGICRRRSPRLHPQIHASDVGATVARRRSTRLHPQIHTSDEGARLIDRRRRRHGSLLDNDHDMLWEILLRLPPQPSSLLRACAVCKRWRRVATDPKFLRCFHAHHRKAPLLGLLVCRNSHKNVFHPVLNPPDRIPRKRFTLGCYSKIRYSVPSCRHGRILVKDSKNNEAVLCDPITGEQHRMPVPPGFDMTYLSGAVLCTAGDQGHVHGSCHASPFKVVLLSMFIHDDRRPLARVFSSQTGRWGNLISIETQPKTMYGPCCPDTLVGNVIYWLSRDDGVVEFDLEGQKLTLIKGPHSMNNFSICQCQIIRTDDCIVGVAMLSYQDIQVWQREVNSEGVSIWLVQKTVALHTIPKTLPQISETMPWNKLMGYDEDTNAMILYMHDSAYMVQLKSIHSTKIDVPCSTKYYPFMSFYLPGDHSSFVFIYSRSRLI